MAAYGVTIVNGHAPIPGAGGAGLGDYAPRRQFGALRSFAGSSDLVVKANRALATFQSDIDTMQAQCEEHEGWTAQHAFDLWAGTDPGETICQNARDLQDLHDMAAQIVNDRYASDAQIVQAMRLLPYSSDVEGAIAAGEATSAGSALEAGWDETLGLPGEAIGAVGEGIGSIGLGLLKGLPWWVWVGAAGLGAYKFGVFKRKG